MDPYNIQDIFFLIIIIRLFEEQNLYGEEAEIKNMKAEKSYGSLLWLRHNATCIL
jgi:hypothetical protein